MMATDLAPAIDPATVERVILHGDLQRLSSAQKVSYYRAVCESVGLNPITQPFQYLVLSGREVLYARREATEQLRRLHKVSLTIAARELVDEVYVVTARATLPDGRTDESIGCVPLAGVKGEARANAMMKAETKAKRRTTLSICGLGMLDETEVESLPTTPTTLVTTRMAEVAPEPDPAAVVTIDAGQVAADTVQNTTPPVGLAPDVVQIIRVEKVATKKAGVFRYYVTFSNHLKAVTIQEWLASACEHFAVGNVPVRIQTKETQWSKQKDGSVVPDLVKVIRADEPDQPGMLDESEIPF